MLDTDYRLFYGVTLLASGRTRSYNVTFIAVLLSVLIIVQAGFMSLYWMKLDSIINSLSSDDNRAVSIASSGEEEVAVNKADRSIHQGESSPVMPALANTMDISVSPALETETANNSNVFDFSKAFKYPWTEYLRAGIRPSLEEFVNVISIPSEIIVKFKPGTPSYVKRQLHESAGAVEVRDLPGLGFTIVRIDSTIDPEVALNVYLSSPYVEYARFAFKYYSFGALTPNDEYFPDQWNLIMMRVVEAWNVTQGSSDLVIAVVDSGGAAHPDLQPNIYINTGEIPNNGIDDDGNGYVDDYMGYDFADNDPYPYATYYHGLAVASVIAAVANNTVGIAGIAPKVKILPLKVAPDWAYGWLDEAAILEALNYIVMMKERGVNIVAVTASWGTLWPYPLDVVMQYEYPLYNAILNLSMHDILLIAAAGNDGINLDDDWYTMSPAEFDLPNIITVGAIDSNGLLASFTNYGYEAVDILAPGVMIPCLYVSHWGSWWSYSVAYASGTSLAVPQVAGVVALIASALQDLNITYDYTMIKAILLSTYMLQSNVTSPYFHTIASKIPGTIDALNAVLNASNLPQTSYKPFGVIEKPAPIRLYSPWQVEYWRWRSEPQRYIGMAQPTVLVAGNNIIFKVYATAMGGPSLVTSVVLFDTVTNTTYILHDDGIPPDEYAGDGVYTGYVNVTFAGLGTNIEPHILVLVVNTTYYSYGVDYLYYVAQVPSYAVIQDDFKWIDISNASVEVYMPAYGPPLILPAPGWVKLYGHNISSLVTAGFINNTYIVITSCGTIHFGPYFTTAPYFATARSPVGTFESVYTIYTILDEYTINYNITISPYAVPGKSYCRDVTVRTAIIGDPPNRVFVIQYNYYDVSVEVMFLENSSDILISYMIQQYDNTSIGWIRFNEFEYTIIDQSILSAGGNITVRLKPAELYVPFIPLEYGVIKLDHNPLTVTFTGNYINPVVVIGPPTYIGTQPTIVRITDITSTGFTARLQEWPYLDGFHILENVTYIVMEAGVYALPDGSLIMAGYGNATAGSWTWVEFPVPFNRTPIVVASVVTFNDPEPVAVRIKGINKTGFWVMLQEQEASDQVHAVEKIAFIAIEPPNIPIKIDTFSGQLMLYAMSVVANSNWATFQSPSNATIMGLVATINTFNGPDTASLRVQQLIPGMTSFTIKIEEETSKDSETGHTNESIGVLLILG
jgi:hypothetical protein